MKLKKRNKRSRIRGRRTCGWAMKKHKGSGNRGGKGMAGTGKKADQRKSWVIKYQFPYFGKQGFTSKSTEKKRVKFINLKDIESRYGAGEINLKGYKILGEGEITKKFVISAKAASKSAREKVEKAGGKVLLLEKEAKPSNIKPEVKKEVKK